MVEGSGSGVFRDAIRKVQMTMKSVKPVSYTNRKGKTYYLHAAVKKSGRTVYVMKTSPKGALTEVPQGYAITEGVNGEVAVGRPKPRQLTEQEETLVATQLECLGLGGYRCAAKGAYITIYEPLRMDIT